MKWLKMNHHKTIRKLGIQNKKRASDLPEGDLEQNYTQEELDESV